MLDMDGLFFTGPTSSDQLWIAVWIGLGLWVLALLLMGYLPIACTEGFKPSADWTDVPMSIVGNFVIFASLLLLQMAVEPYFILRHKLPIYSLNQIADGELWKWIIGHVLVGGGLYILISVNANGEKNTFLLTSALPMAVLAQLLVLLGIMLWPTLFSFDFISTAIIVSQHLVAGILSIPLGILAIYFIIIAPLQWLTD